jgi:peroxiredoxin
MSNLLKSFYISLYVSALVAASLHIGTELYSNASIFWAGAAISIWPACFFFIRLFMSPVARTSANLNGLMAYAGLGLMVGLLTYTKNADAVWFFLYHCGLGVSGLLLYVHWYSHLGRAPSEALQDGSSLPEFELKKSDGSAWRSSESNNYPALMLFFRGNWCPLCMAQIKEIAGLYQQLEQMGVSVLLVSPQPEKHTQALAAKFDVNFSFLIDQKGAVAAQLGIDAKQGTPKGMEALGYESDTVLPTAIAIDAQGKIIWTDQTDNYRVRPEPQMFIDVFRDHGLSPS